MALYEACHSRLTRYVQSVVWNSDDVKDIVSETVCRVYEKFDTIHKKESLIFYFFRTASRLITDKQKEKKFRTDDQLIMMNRADVNANSAYRAEVADLHKALKKLPPEQAEAVVLFEISGFSLNEISEIQNISLSGVKSRVTRGRELLKKILTETTRQLAKSG